MTTQTQDLLARVQALHTDIANGRIVEALNEFYDPQVEMQEGLQPATVGLAANLEREQAWLDNVAEWRSFELVSLATSGQTTFAETSMEFVLKDGTAVRVGDASLVVRSLAGD